MNIHELLKELDDKNVKLIVDESELDIIAPVGTITPEIRERLSLYKNKIIDILNNADKDQIPLKKSHHNGPVPLSFAQQRLWFINQFEGGQDISYNMPWAFRVVGDLDITALIKAFQTIVQRHESLRTIFRPIDGKAMQIIIPELSLDIPIVEVTEADVPTHIHEYACYVFDLSEGPLIKIGLLRLSPKEHVLLINMHHIISDGWSMGLFNKELKALYRAYINGEESPLPPLPVQYADFTQWQRQWLQGEILNLQVNYWKKQLEGAPDLLEFPTDYPRPAVQSYHGDMEIFIIPNALTDRLIAVGHEESATLFMVLMAAFKVLLHRYTGLTDICAGTAIANRQQKELEGLIGFFVNTLVLRDHVQSKLTFRELLSRVKETAMAAYAHQDVPFEHLVEVLKPERSLSYMPLAQILLVLQNTPQAIPALQGLTLSMIGRRTQTSKFDMIMDLSESPEGIEGILEYSTDLFDKTTIKRLIDHFQILLESITDNPEQTIAALPLLSENERQKLLVEWNDTEAAYPAYQCIHQWFEAQENKIPKAPAVVYENQQLSYEELNKRSNQLAHYLIDQGVGPEIRVGLCLERSLEMVIGILGILKAGGAYVPIDPDNPAERIKYILADSNISLLLTQTNMRDKILENQTITSICLDRDWPMISQASTENPHVKVMPENLSYVIYTSGSTGQPKGTLVSHANVVQLFIATEHQYSFSKDDVWTLFHSYAFDFSVWEIWGALFYGGKVIIVPYWISREPERFYQLVYEEGVTVLNQTPSAFKQFIAADKALDFSPGVLTLRYVIFGGEALDIKSLHPWFERHGDQQPKLINMYGITETTVHVTYYPVDETDAQRPSSVIGRQLAHLQAYILDKHLQVVPIGVPGELYVGGGGVTRGYHERPALTAGRFIPNPFSKYIGGRLYKTGDLIRQTTNSNMEYMGRIDQQVKIRGFRIELGEIGAKLLGHPAIQNCEVMTREDEPGNKHLVAYLVLDHNYELPDIEASELNSEAVSQWQDVFENNYSTSDTTNPFQDFTGWNESYDGEPIHKDEMLEWADTTVDRILELQPKHILEIGCGTGLLLGRLVPHCESYVGTDFSPTVLKQLENKLSKLGEHAHKVKLMAGPANNLSNLADQTFDTIILNSIVQYFPNLEYMLAVLEETWKLLSPAGKFFIGDVRHLDLLDTFHASVQLHKIKDPLKPASELRHLAQYHSANDNELVIAPAFFNTLKATLPDITHVQIIPKLGNYQNELSKYRYDVVLHTSELLSLIKDISWIPWNTEGFSTKDIQTKLSKVQPNILAIKGIPNSRLAKDINILKFCDADNEEIDTVASLRTKLESVTDIGMNPYELKQIAESISYTTEFSLASGAPKGAFDVVFYKQTNNEQLHPLSLFAFEDAQLKNTPYKTLSNNPRFQDLKRELLSSLRDYLLQTLPNYMVPSYFVFLDTFPLTANGKIDRKALPAPDVVALQTQEYVAPASYIEQKLVTVWADVLGLEADQLGTHTNFFELGGDSILSLQVIARARRLGLQFTPKQLFEYQTIADLSRVVKRDSGVEAEQGQVIGEFPFIPIQHWFFDQNLVDNHHFNQAFLLEVSNTLKEEALSGAIEALMIHHDALRLRFKSTDTGWTQWLTEWNSEALLSYIDLSPLTPELQRTTLEREASKIQVQLNIQQGPLLRAGWFHLGGGKPDRLLIAIHHLAVDGVSWRILLEDFETAYRQLEANKPVKLPPKTTSYKSWSEHLQAYAQSDDLRAELEYWSKLGRYKPSPLPQDRQYTENENTLASSSIYTVIMDNKNTHALLQEAPAAYNTQVNDILLTALIMAFYQWTGEDILLFDLEGHGREDLFDDVDLSRTVGWFTTIYPVLLTLESNTDLGTALKSVKEQLRQIPNRGIGYGLLRYCNRESSVTDALASVSASQVRFNYLGQLDKMMREEGFFKWAEESPGKHRSPQHIRPLLIDVNSMVMNECLQINIEYCDFIHNEKTIKRLSTYFIDSIQKLVDHCLSPDAGGYTPSDFPEANLDSNELDVLLDTLEVGHE